MIFLIDLTGVDAVRWRAHAREGNLFTVAVGIVVG